MKISDDHSSRVAKLNAARKKLKKFQSLKAGKSRTERSDSCCSGSEISVQSESLDCQIDSDIIQFTPGENAGTISGSSTPTIVPETTKSTTDLEFYAQEKSGDIRSLLDRMNGLLANKQPLAPDASEPLSFTSLWGLRTRTTADKTNEMSSEITANAPFNNIQHLESQKPVETSTELDQYRAIQQDAQAQMMDDYVRVKEIVKIMQDTNKSQIEKITILENQLHDRDELMTRLHAENEFLQKSNQELLATHEVHNIQLMSYSQHHQHLTQQWEESKADLAELRERLKQSQKDISTLKSDRDSFLHKYEMSQIYISQLSNADPPRVEAPAEPVVQVCNKCDQAVHDLHLALEERDRLECEWRKQTERLQRQINELQNTVQQISVEKDGFWERCVLAEAELERRQTAAETIASANELIEDIDSEPLEKTVQCEEELPTGDTEQVQENLPPLPPPCSSCLQYQLQTQEMERSLWMIQNNYESLKDELAEKTEAADSTRLLLESVRGDKTALSRALTQNKQLKQRFQELEDKFIKMSEQNMQMATELEHERYLRTSEQRPTPSPDIESFDNHSTGSCNSSVSSDRVIPNVSSSGTGTPTTELVDPPSTTPSLLNELELLREEYNALQQRLTLMEMENQRLESAVTQLDSETHTIDEYVLLYRSQRILLHQKATWWQLYAQQLLNGRNAIDHRLEHLEKILKNATITANWNGNSPPLDNNDDDDSELEAIVFSKSTPLEGEVVEFSKPNSNCSISLQDILQCVNDLRSDLHEFSSHPPGYESIAAKLQTNTTLLNQHTVGSSTVPAPDVSLYRAEVPSCKCCSGKLLVI